MAVGCIQDPESPLNLPDTPTLSVDETSVTRVSMVVSGSFGSNMTDITTYGVEISETLFESGGTYKTLVPQEMGADGFSLGVSDLKSNSTYFLRAFISNGHSRMYSTTLTQKTPETSVASISDVTLKDDYYLVATIEDNGGRSIEDVGFMWSTSAERKDIKREKRYPATLSGDGKTFTLPVNEVGEGTHYIMAYAEDDKDGTGYSRIPFEWVVTSDQGVAIEDPNFKKYLLMYHDGNEDGKMSYAEMEAIESIDVHTDNIKSVREINMMPRLHSLVVSGTQQGSGQLTSLDMSKNTGLSALDCSNNKLTSLDVSALPELDMLYCQGNSLYTLDVSKNSHLHHLNCLNNPMDTLFMSYYQELGMLQYPEGTVIKYVDAPAVEPEVELTPVDLGLSVKWANLNLGSKSPEAYGDYYAWGETETKTEYNWSTYKWANGSINSLTKYNTESDYGVVDNNSTLEAEDDVASVRLGDLWRMPTEDEWRELRNKCTWTWTSVNDVEGYQVSNSNGVSIFLPTGGSRNYGSHNDAGSRGLYWSASVGTGYPGYAWSLAFDSKDFFAYNYRYEGLSVRPVWGERPEKPGMNVNKYLTFTSEGTTTVSLQNVGDNVPVLYFSYDSENWNLWDYSELSFTQGKPVYISGYNPDGFNRSTKVYSCFTAIGDSFAVSGDIMSLLDRNNEVLSIPSEYCFCYLFQNCTQLKSGPELSAKTLNNGCYAGLFNNCSGLSIAPVLSSTNLARACYANMFDSCTSLVVAPELPATALFEMCYLNMFLNCTSLTQAPELPAHSLPEDCYSGMFQGCSSLTTAPALPAERLGRACYGNMFAFCTSLVDPPALPATSFQGSYSTYCYYGMFRGCTSLTSAPVLPVTELSAGCYNEMFRDCTNLIEAPDLPATTLAEQCYVNMFSGCTSLTVAPALPATILASQCYSGMFEGCVELISAPELPAGTLREFCYSTMFSGCTNLNYVKCLATDITADRCVDGWLNNVSSIGSFVKAPDAQWPTGSSGIPEGWTVVDAD